VLTPALVTLTLSGPPGTPPPDFTDALEYAEVTISDDDVLIEAFDADDEPLGSISMWIDERGTTWLASDYADGYALVGVDPAGQATVYRESTLPADVLATRAETIVDTIQTAPLERAEWFLCAVAVGTATGMCAGAAATGGLLFVGCAAGAAGATCACISAWAERKGKRKCLED
jgi:hypothetical protein